jgi:hypothetical protein
VAVAGTSTSAPDLAKVTVVLTDSSGGSIRMNDVGLITTMSRSATVAADGTFELDGILPGAFRLSLRGQPPDWWPATAMVGGRDILDVPLEIGSDDVSGVDIVLSDRHSQIAGRLEQAGGAPATGYFVVAFTTERTLWTPQSRRMKSVRPGTDGRFAIDDLPAGEYFLAALTDADSEDWQTREFLQQVVGAAIKVTLAEGERKVQDLRIAR